jgi:uncharacterized delta-60 repeat protein
VPRLALGMLVGISLIWACAAVAMTRGAPGSLDPSFGRGGRVFASFSRFDTASGVAVQRSGAVLVSGRVGGRISTVRFDARGRLDRSFGRGGLVREAVGDDPEEGPVRVVLQRDGKIVFAGTTRDLNGDRQLGDGAVAVYRLRPNGDPDLSFGSRGVAVLRRRGELLGSELAIDPAGRIVVVTRFHDVSRDALLVDRLTRRGRLDPSFGHGGEQVVRFGTQSFLGSAAVDGQGRIYVAGADLAQRTLSVLRLTSRGALDQGFGARGIARLPHRGTLALPSGVAVQPDGRILLAGEESFSGATPPAPCGYCLFLTLGRLTRSGRPDRTFGQAGVVHTRLELTPSGGPELALQRDGRIVVAGGIMRGPTSSFLLARLLRTGAFDPSFGRQGRGYTVTDMRSSKRQDDQATALVIARDGRLVVAGRSARDALEGGGQSGRIQFRFAVARFFP